MKHVRWNEPSRKHRWALGFASGVQLTLATIAWTDLAARSPAEIRGSKSLWAVVIAVNFVGPIAYLSLGRRPMDPAA